jgi:hypothetical protein
MSMRLILAAGLSFAAIMSTLPTADAQQRNRVDIRQAGVTNEIAGRQRGYRKPSGPQPARLASVYRDLPRRSAQRRHGGPVRPRQCSRA